MVEVLQPGDLFASVVNGTSAVFMISEEAHEGRRDARQVYPRVQNPITRSLYDGARVWRVTQDAKAASPAPSDIEAALQLPQWWRVDVDQTVWDTREDALAWIRFSVSGKVAAFCKEMAKPSEARAVEIGREFRVPSTREMITRVRVWNVAIAADVLTGRTALAAE